MIDSRSRLTGSAGLLVLAAQALAADPPPRQHAAHAHGHAAVNVVIEGGELAIELRVPAVNVIGFEHRPASAAEQRAVHDALATLRDAGALFTPSAAARCRPARVLVEMQGMEGENPTEAPLHDHAPEAASEHRHASHGGNEAHSELHGEYHFQCAAPDRLSHLEMRILEHLHDVERVEARLVTPSAQRATTLRPGAMTLELGRR